MNVLELIFNDMLRRTEEEAASRMHEGYLSRGR